MKQIIIGCVCFFTLVLFIASTHLVREGNVGVYYRFGKLLTYHTTPGFNIKPFWVISSEILIRPQTDAVQNISCGTNDGLIIYFDLEVGNTLPEDKVLHVIKTYGEEYDIYLVKNKVRHQLVSVCNGMKLEELFITKFDTLNDLLLSFLQHQMNETKSGLIIDFVKVNKPIVPKKISEDYQKIAEEKTALKVEIERQEKLKKQEEINNSTAINNAEMNRQRAEIQGREQLEALKIKEQKEVIEARISADKENVKAEAKRKLAEIQYQEQLDAAKAKEMKEEIEARIATEKENTKAEAKRKLAEIQYQEQLDVAKALEMKEEIENRMFEAKEKAKADAEKYKAEKEAESYTLLLAIPNYLELKRTEALINGKISFGDHQNIFVTDQDSNNHKPKLPPIPNKQKK